MAFEPSSSLRSRTFLGLILAQFLAAFNDQAIHASAMFFAIKHKALTQAQAISLMPILFYAPWAIFCTVAGYLADRYSKRSSLVFWKVAEIGITLVALLGFWLGASFHYDHFGPAVVLSTVFLMGTHSAFFVPAKYGAMPEILQPHLLSKGNGVLESTSFLAVILGTVSGGILSDERVFKGHEYFIGLILVALAVVGALASLLIGRMPAANSGRVFPANPFRPLLDNLRVMVRSRPLALSVLGIAFFTFMVAFMRSTMYMHGETRSPRWTELHTSMVVATVALGVGLGSPLAGFLSGGKVELGLVPLGAVGMILATAVAAFAVFTNPSLIAALILIGFFSGFYIVPLYTLLQHRAPKTSKGDLIATSNFINVTGAIAASLLFFGLVFAAHRTGVAPEVRQEAFTQGELQVLKYHHGRPAGFQVVDDSGKVVAVRTDEGDVETSRAVAEGPIELGNDDIKAGQRVEVTRYVLARDGRKVAHYMIRPAGTPPVPAYDNEILPRYLFLGASGMTLAILILLCRQLPDFFVRALLWVRTHGRYRLRVVGVNNLPSNGPVVLATNCDRFQECMQVIAATDRFTRFVLLESAADDEPRPFLRFLARRTGVEVLRHGRIDPAGWAKALSKGGRALSNGDMLGITIESQELAGEADRLFQELAGREGAALLPVYCETERHDHGGRGFVRRVRVVIGAPLPAGTPIAEVRHAIRELANGTHPDDHGHETPTILATPGAAGASPTGPAATHPRRP